MQDLASICDLSEDLWKNVPLRRTVLDLRQANRACTCPLCASSATALKSVLKIQTDPWQKNGIQSFTAEISSLSIPALRCASPCACGGEPVSALLKKNQASLIYGNYVGAVYSLPSLRAAYVRWSGNDADVAGLKPLMRAIYIVTQHLGVKSLILDPRNRTTLPKTVRRLLRGETLSLLCKGLNHFYSIGPWIEGGIGDDLRATGKVSFHGIEFDEFPSLALATKALRTRTA